MAQGWVSAGVSGPRIPAQTLQPWARQSSKRLVKAPKVYVRDSGLVHALLGLGTYAELMSRPVVGGIEHVPLLELLTLHQTVAR